MANSETYPRLAVVSGLWLCIAAIILLTPTPLADQPNGWLRLGGLGLTIALVLGLATVYVGQFHLEILSRGGQPFRLLATIPLAVLAVRLGAACEQAPPIFVALVVGAACAFLIALSFPRRAAFGLTAFLNIILGLSLADGALSDQFGADGPAWLAELVLVLMVGGSAAVFLLRQVRDRTRLMQVGFQVGLAYAVAAFAAAVLLEAPDSTAADPTLTVLNQAARQAGLAFLAGPAVGITLTALLPYLERLLRVTTSINLIELSDASRPLLRRLALEAPGTFNHSLLVGTISEAAAEDIGADGLLCRVGCYYHDIGKLYKPEYYIENQAGGPNKHDELSPSMSKLIIANHPKVGLEMAAEAGLPTVLLPFIATHHGTTVMEYFYRCACKQRADGHPEINDADFRYPGPKPPTRETAIVMLADGIEGAVRSMAEPTHNRIEDTVEAMVLKRLTDGQLDECDLTFAELSRVKQSFVRSLTSHYHGRIAYPTPAPAPTTAESSLPKPSLPESSLPEHGDEPLEVGGSSGMLRRFDPPGSTAFAKSARTRSA